MNLSEVMEKIEDYKPGRFINIKWKRPVKTIKSYTGSEIIKSTFGVSRMGIAYDNMKAVVEMRLDGRLPTVNAGLPWGAWFKKRYIIEHKGRYYLRVYTVPGTELISVYYLDKQTVDKRSIRDFCLKSEFSKRNKTGCITVNIDYIEKIG